jgi:hypothetical protein
VGGDSEKSGVQGTWLCNAGMRELSREESDRLRALQLDCVDLLKEGKRVYPNGTLGANLIGAVDQEQIGNAGLEAGLNDDLRGRNGIGGFRVTGEGVNPLPLAHSLSLRTRLSRPNQRVLLNYSWPRFAARDNLSAAITGMYELSRDIRTFSYKREVYRVVGVVTHTAVVEVHAAAPTLTVFHFTGSGVVGFDVVRLRFNQCGRLHGSHGLHCTCRELAA